MTAAKRRTNASQPEPDRIRKVFTARLTHELTVRIRETARRHDVDVETLLTRALDALDESS